jgi:hypothetical protein
VEHAQRADVEPSGIFTVGSAGRILISARTRP